MHWDPKTLILRRKRSRRVEAGDELGGKGWRKAERNWIVHFLMLWFYVKCWFFASSWLRLPILP